MEIAAPQLLRESAASADPVRMTRDEEIADASFRAADFASLDREHLSVQGCLFTGCLFAGSVLARFAVFGRGFPQLRFLERRPAGVQSPPRTVRRLQTFGNEFRRNHAQPPAVRTLQGRVRQFRLFAAAHGAFCGLSDARRRFRGRRFERVEFAQCDLTQAEFFGTRLRGLSFADSDIRGIRVREIGSFELKGLKISPLQAVELARLLGVEIEE